VDDSLDSDGIEMKGWRFRTEETCRGYWEVEAIRERDGARVFRNGTIDPKVLLEECLSEARELNARNHE